MEEPKTRKPRKKETQPRKKETQPRKKRSPETKRRNPTYEGLTQEQVKTEVKKNHYLKSGKLYQAIRRRCIKHDMKKEDFKKNFFLKYRKCRKPTASTAVHHGSGIFASTTTQPYIGSRKRFLFEGEI